jgi:hypothetical protein
MFWSKVTILSESSGFHSSKYEDDSLLGYCVITLTMKAVNTSETSIYEYVCETSWHIIPESCHLLDHHQLIIFLI